MQTILVPLDGSPFSEHALPTAIAIARSSGMPIALAQVHHMIFPTVPIASDPYFEPTADNRIRENETAYLEDVSRRIGEVWDGPISRVLLEMPIVDALCSYARTIDAAMIVLSSHGRGGIARAWLGSVADRLIRQSPVPTLVVHPRADVPDLSSQPTFEHILIPLDGSPLAEDAVELALRFGKPMNAHYTLIQVIEPIIRGFMIDGAEPYLDVDAEAAAWQHASDYLEGVAARLREQGHVVMTLVPIGKPASTILSYTQEHPVSLITMTTHGRSGVARMLVGSVADKVLRGADMPLLVYRPAEVPEIA